jgi:hypothetical protein
MAKNNLVWLVVLAAVLALVYYLYEGGKFSEGNTPFHSIERDYTKYSVPRHDTNTGV